MSQPLRWILATLFAGLVIALIYAFSQAAVDARHREHTLPMTMLQPQLVTQKQAPEFTLRDRRGRPYRLGELRGQPVVLNFWSASCIPCREELPSLIVLDQLARHRKTFSVITVCVEESWDEVREAFPNDDPSSLVVLFDPKRSVVEKQYGTKMFPETFLIDSDGDISARFDGKRSWASPIVLNMIEGL